MDKQQCSCKSNFVLKKGFPTENQDRNHMQTIRTSTTDPFNGVHVVSPQGDVFIHTTAV